MERLRWLQRDPPETRIDVNTAAAFLDYWRDGQHVDHRNVIAGEPTSRRRSCRRRSSAWSPSRPGPCPRASARRSSPTKSQQWLADNNFVMKDGQYVQQSGPKNSLGLVKFDMDDKQAIYLHDTPAKALFGMPDRHRSHGCVRVENALAVRDDARRSGRRARPVPAGDAEQTTRPSSSCRTRSRSGCSTRPHSGTARRSSSGPTSMAGTTMSRKALGLEPGRPRKIQQPESSDDIGP